jgi:predicted nuclease with TOPRIM domain
METIPKSRYDQLLRSYNEVKADRERFKKLLQSFVHSGEELAKQYREKDKQLEEMKEQVELLVLESKGLLENYELLKTNLDCDNRKN